MTTNSPAIVALVQRLWPYAKKRELRFTEFFTTTRRREDWRPMPAGYEALTAASVETVAALGAVELCIEGYERDLLISACYTVGELRAVLTSSEVTHTR